MNKARIKKIIPRIIFLLISLYLLLLLICTVAVFKMQTLSHKSTGWGVVLAEYRLDFANYVAETNHFDIQGTLYDHSEISFPTVEQRKIKFICAISLMPLWRRGYNNPFVHDGAQWHTIISYAKKEKVTYGSNAYPITYPLVYNAIMSMFD